MVVEFPTPAAAMLAVRLAGRLRKIAMLPTLAGLEVSSSKTPVPLLCEPSYAPRLEFSRPYHKTENDRPGGHSVALNWTSPCAILSACGGVADRWLQVRPTPPAACRCLQ